MNELTRFTTYFLHLARILGQMKGGEVTDIRAFPGAIWSVSLRVGILTGR